LLVTTWQQHKQINQKIWKPFKTAIAFEADSTMLRGWLFLPKNRKAPFPLIVMTHGWGSVKEMYLEEYAEAFGKAGLATLIYDHRNFGSSDGLHDKK
jgi:fermentation-respiration switch protein FrsA (DUF1100 family)